MREMTGHGLHGGTAAWALLALLPAAPLRAADGLAAVSGVELFVSRSGDDALNGRAAERDAAKQDAAKKRIDTLQAREKEIDAELPRADDDAARRKLEQEKADAAAERRKLESVLASGPFATLERAREEVRRLKAAGLPAGGVTVWIAAGTYELQRTLAFTAADGGTAEAPVVWRARPGEEVRLSAGRAVPAFQPVTDAAALARLPDAARGRVVQADLPALGVRDFGEMGGGFGKSGLPGLELFVNDQPMGIARYPNEGFLRISEVLGKTEVNVRGTKGCKEGLFRTDEKRVAAWAKEKDPRVLGYWFWDWADERHKVRIDAGTLTLEVTPPYHGYGYRQGQWFYGFNLLCEIDQPGEWVLDRETGIVYVWPPKGPGAPRGMVSVLKEAVTLTGVSHLTLRGLVIEGARANGVEMSGCTACALVGCTIRNHGSWAVRVEGGAGCVVRGCDVLGTGDGGISLSGGDRKTLAPGGHAAENNHIHHYSRWNRTYRPGISLSGVGQRAANNLIHHAPHQAFGFSGNDHVIEYNEVHNVCEESNDAGVMYAWNDWAARGHVIRHNFIHHVYGHEGRGCSGVYLDDHFSIADIVGNIFYKMPRAIQIGGGRDATIENNVFVECWPALNIDARGLGWRAYGKDELVQKLKAWPFTAEPWRSRYPRLLTLLDDEPMAPKGHVIARNICVDGKWDGNEPKARPYLKYVDNLVDEDPRFVGREKGDFRLRPDSPALKRGFKPIPVEKIGLQKDAARASWPVEHPVTEHEIRYAEKRAPAGGKPAKPAGGAR